MARIFLSYARDDAAKASALAACLERAGHSVWWDRHIHGGSEYSGEIETALRDADAILVLWSQPSIHSAWVRDEAAEGRDSGRLIPLLLDGSVAPLGFRQFQSISISGWSGRGNPPNFQEILTSIADHAGHEPAATEAPKIAKPTLSRPIILALLAALGALLLAIGGWWLIGGRGHASAAPVVAVLPFSDLSPQRNKAYFAEGLAEEILSALAAEEGIQVLGRTSARQIERDANPKKLREKLGITHLLEGSARSVGDQLRVNVRLIDTSDGRRVWEEVYQGRIEDVFAVQDHVAASVAHRLRRTLFEPKVRVSQQTKPETYQSYLAARALARNRTDNALAEALALAKNVVRSDPKYAPGHALLAELYYLLSDDDGAYGDVPFDQARKLATPHAREAIRLSPNTADGYAALALIEGNSAVAIEPLIQALKLDPSRADIRVWLGLVLNFAGRHDEALSQYRAAVDIEPLWSVTVNTLVEALIANGQYRKAIQAAEKFEARGGDRELLPPIDVLIAHWKGDLSSAIELAEAQRSRRTPHQAYRDLMAADLNLLGLGKEGSAALDPRSGNFRASYYARDLARLHRDIASAGPRIWRMPDSQLALQHLARLRDWQRLSKLFDERPFRFAEFCDRFARSSSTFVLALRARNRSTEAEPILTCFRDFVVQEARKSARDPSWPGELEFRHATLSSLAGDKPGTLRWLDQAISRGWLGQRYSSRLTDYPQFDGIRSDRRFPGLQQKIDAKLQTERTELLLRRASRS